MNYIQIKWTHSISTEPLLMYSELDKDRWEVRKVEVFRDGHRGFASPVESFGGTRLGKEPIPPLTEIAADSQFEPIEISREEFERLWANRGDNDKATAG